MTVLWHFFISHWLIIFWAFILFAFVVIGAIKFAEEVLFRIARYRYRRTHKA